MINPLIDTDCFSPESVARIKRLEAELDELEAIVIHQARLIVQLSRPLEEGRGGPRRSRPGPSGS